jgi:D-3-phosphoglycerate dehydrogenase
MKPVIWYEFTVDEANRKRLETAAQVVCGGAVTANQNVFATVVSAVLDAGPAFMDSVGPGLRVIARPGIGTDNVDLHAATERGILVINTPTAPTESTAEHTVALILAAAKKVVTGNRFLEAGDIPRPTMMGMELRDRVLGVVGFGRIGRRVAEICGQGLKMKILVYDPFITSSEMPGVEFAKDLDDLLGRADVVTLHLPLAQETRGLIGEGQLRRMRPGAYLVNAARGPIVDEAALIRALEDGHLAGAGLDVFDPEPPEGDNPLLRMRNVVCTPHIASFTDRGQAAMRTGIVDQLLQLLAGERPANIVNPAAWPGRMTTKV